MTEGIEILGADANNLKRVDVTLPRHALTAIVGVSGSGKSSLVEDTIAATAAERMRRFLDIDQPALRGPHVDAFVGALPPMLFAGQRAFRASVRTTLGTSTGLLRLLRRLFVGFSEPFAEDVGEAVPEPSPASFAAWLKRHGSGRATVWGSPVVDQRTDGVAAVEKLRKAGVQQVVIRSETDRGAKAERGTPVQLAKFKPLRADVRHTIEACIGVVDLAKTAQPALEELLERGWKAAPSSVFIELHDDTRPELRRAFAFGLDARVHRVHPRSPHVYARADAHRLTFNAPKHLETGACPTCAGLGVSTGLDEGALVAHPERSMHGGAFVLWTPKNYRYVNIQHVTIEGLRGREGFDPDLPWRKLSTKARTLILEGTADKVQGIDPRIKKKSGAPMVFVGFRRAITERAASPSAKPELKALVGEGPCSSCGGTRWAFQTRALRVAGWSIDRLLALPLVELEHEARKGTLATGCPPSARPLVAGIARSAAALASVGLGHLSADRGMLDVSDGESRRTRLAGVLTSRLAGLLLVLDEPARGLHEHDLVSLGDALVDAARRHTVIISEHRQRIITRADHVVELGSGAGPAGGRITHDGPVEGTTWAHLDRVEPRAASATSKAVKWLSMEGVRIHNVQGAAVSIPLGAITCIAGVSGSGKSSFVRGALVPALVELLPSDRVDAEDFKVRRGTWDALRGAEQVKALYALDQAAAAAQRRSLVMTFLGLAETMRNSFGRQPEAKGLGLLPVDFSTNRGHGRCPRCLGLGTLDDGEECAVCGGRRFGADTLAVRVGDLSFSELLAAPVDALLDRQLPPELEPEVLRAVAELGVGHLSLGRSLDTLSGGEVQRLRIARALAKHKVQGALFVLDEPAGGLHPSDVKRLRSALTHMVAAGHTVVLVEHDPHLLATCDHVVEFGPGSGPEGGRVIASGSPAEIRGGDTPTGFALRGLPRAHHGRAVDSPDRSGRASTRAVALRARAEIRQILGEDVQVPDEGDEIVTPSAILAEAEVARRPLELADLDSAVLSILLDAVRPDVEAQLDQAVAAWDSGDLEPAINPLLEAVAEWGRALPTSVVATARKHRAAMGLEWPDEKAGDPLALRARCARLAGTDPSREARRAALRDALALGGGYVELVDARGKVRRQISERLIDFGAGRVGPRRAAPAHFRRLELGGRCPMCQGRSTVSQPDRRLLVSRPSGRVVDDKSLSAGAMAILKGVWRSETVPFFRRLAEEGLWDASASWSSLGAEQEGIVLHGFWVRPGYGTFLKPGSKVDGSEVNHWLRWDGLVAAIDGQIERSKDVGWRDEVRTSREDLPCPRCGGSGVGPHASLLELGGKPFDVWLRKGRLDAFLSAFEGVHGLPPRAIRERKRVSYCLEPLRASDPPLGKPVTGPAAHEVLRRAARQFADMDLVAD